MKKTYEHIFALCFDRATSYMNKTQCGFITSFRRYDTDGNALPINEKRRRSKNLEADIRASGLTFIKASGWFVESEETGRESGVAEDTFCVINNRFAPKDYIKLMVSWCAKYEQDAVLITDPQPERSHKNGQPLVNKAINVVGTYYDKHGNIDMQFDNATVQDVEEYLTNICGKDFVLSSTDICETAGHSIYTAVGRVLGLCDFKDLYPVL